MPLQKLRLNLADAYQSKVAARYLCEMLACFANGKAHSQGHLLLGSEQGLAGWDDFVIECENGGRIFHQVKRYGADFCKRSAKRTRNKDGKLPDLSELDKVFAKLAEVSVDDLTSNDRFHLDVMSARAYVKRAVTVDALRQLTLECRKPGVAAERLNELEIEPKFTKLFTWLTSWCEFRDWDHIHRMLSRVEVHVVEDETQLKAGAVSFLGVDWTEPQTLFVDMSHFVQDTASYVGALDARILWEHFQGRFEPTRARWTRYLRPVPAAAWEINGIQHVAADQIEPAVSVVEGCWGSRVRSHLDLATNPPARLTEGTLSLSLSRLTLHLPHGSIGRASQPNSWQRSIWDAAGHTLGTSERLVENDVPVEVLNELPRLAGSRQCNLGSQERREAAELHDHMDRLTWGQLLDEVATLLAQHAGAEKLIDNLRERWQGWQTDWSEAEKSCVMADLLKAAAEGEQVIGRLRVGPRTVKLMAEAVLLRLLVDVAVGGNGTWDFLKEDLPVRTLALDTWAGPSGAARGPQQVDRSPAAAVLAPGPHRAPRAPGSALPSDERCAVVVIAGVRCSATSWLQPSMAEDAASHHNLAAEERRLVITNDPELHRELQDTSCLDQFGVRLRKLLKARSRSREDASTALDRITSQERHAS